MKSNPRIWGKITARVVFYSLFAIVAGTLIAILVPVSHSPGKFTRIKLAQIQMHNLASAMNDYRRALGTYPIGDNAAVLRALMGTNSQQLVFLDADLRWFNTNGAYVDPWQTPYEIKIRSTNSVSIRSAGRNKRFGDADDVTDSP